MAAVKKDLKREKTASTTKGKKIAEGDPTNDNPVSDAPEAKKTAPTEAEIQAAFDQNQKDEAARLAQLEKDKKEKEAKDKKKRDATKPVKKTKIKVTGKGDQAKRLDQILNNDLVAIEPGKEQLPLDKEPISATKHPRLMEYLVPGTQIRLLGMRDPNEVPTDEERVEMARRLNEVSPLLPKYIRRMSLSAAVIPAPTETKPDEKSDGKKPEAVGTKKKDAGIPNGVPLKKICAEVKIEPKLARRILRSKGKKPGGRWEWEAKDVDGIKKLLKEEAAKLASAS